VPAPASAGGLSRDFAGESSFALRSSLAQFQQRYTAQFHQRVSSYATAIYANAAPGKPSSSATVTLVYLGLNTTGGPHDPASTVQALMRGMYPGTLRNTSTVQVTGLPGDTSAQCTSAVVDGNSEATCVWATDQTVSLIFSLPAATDTKLALVLKKI